MYRNCIFCHGMLGSNDAVEHFPVGSRLAFDQSKGRLWVICRACSRWNLTPIEERWEAIEECERLFRTARRRASTGQIALARMPSGLDLIRIGSPLRPEFAGWRYGARLTGRRYAALRRNVLITAGGLGVGLGIVVVGGFALPALGISAIGGGAVGNLLAQKYMALQRREHWHELRERTLARLRSDAGRPVVLQGWDVDRVRLIPWGGEHHWGLRLSRDDDQVELTGPDAIRALGLLSVLANDDGGKPSEIRTAAEALEDAGGPAEYVRRCVTWNQKMRHSSSLLLALPRITRLALEIAAHEDFERAALEIDLRILTHAWREAEELAAIADDLLLPAGVEEFLARNRPRPDP